jgi:hypothetical protein
MLELWVAIDKICTSIDARLRDYSPEIPLDFLEPLLLPQVRQIQRARNVESYIQARHESQIPGLPRILGDPAPMSFATRYFDTCNVL